MQQNVLKSEVMHKYILKLTYIFFATTSLISGQNVKLTCNFNDFGKSIANPEDCASFIECRDDGSAYVMTCSYGLEWNDLSKICDSSENSICNNRLKISRRPPISSPRTTRTTTTTTTLPTLPEFECPTDDIAATSCIGPKDCLYPNPDDIYSYIQCIVNADNITGTPFVRPCPENLEWNDNIKECAPTPTTGKPTTSTSRPTEVPFQCPPKDIADTGCSGPKDCLYPNPSDCGSFIQCTINADNITGTPFVIPCPENLQWNDDIKECDHPESSTCDYKTRPPKSNSSSELPTVGSTRNAANTKRRSS